MKKLDFDTPFSGFSHMGFFNCMAAVHTHFAFPQAPTEYKNGWDYEISPGGMQEDWLFLFGTMSGYNSTLESLDGQKQRPADQSVYADFCMKFAGMRYHTVTDAAGFKDALVDSIERGYPVIAVLNQPNQCRVLIGCDEDAILCADPQGVEVPTEDVTYADIKALYVITERGEPEYTLVDGLKNLEASLVAVLDGRYWDMIVKQFDYWENGYAEKPLEETKKLFERLTALMCNFDHCHNVSTVFCHKAHPELWDDRLAKASVKIDGAYFDAHETQWALQALHDCRHWHHPEWCSKESGMFMFVRIGAENLRKDDKAVLAAVRKMIAVLNG